MTGIEIALLVVGCVFMLASFFVSEKLSGKEINRIAELSDDELKRIIGKGMENAGSQIEYVVEEKVEEASEKIEIAMERESNMKIMAINEYSDTVIESMKKTHDENMFLYSMLNDKHTEMTSLTGDLQRLAANIRNLQESEPNQNTAAADVQTDVKKTEVSKIAATVAEDLEESPEFLVNELERKMLLENHNDMILTYYKEGMSKVDIARKLNLGIGEVSLVIELYKGEEK